MKKLLFLFMLFFTTISCAQTKKSTKETLYYTDFELQQLNSTENFKLSSVVGKNLILLNFWTTWCPYCVREIPELNEIYQKYSQKGLEVVGVNIGEPKREVENFVISKDVKYKIILDQKGEVARKYSVRGIPTNFLINLKGEVIFSGHSLPDSNLIEKNLPKSKNKN